MRTKEKVVETAANKERRKEGSRPGCKPLVEETKEGERVTGFVCYSFHRSPDPESET